MIYEAYIGDSFLDCDENLDRLIASLVKDWPEIGEDESIAVWKDEKRLVAVMHGTAAGWTEVIRFDQKAVPASAAA